MPEFSDYHHQIGDNLKFLYESLGLREVFERLDELDGKGGPPEEPEFNPTNNPMVQPNLEGVGSLSGGPRSENQGTLDVLEPERMEKLKEDAEAQAEAQEEKEKEEPKKTASTSTAKTTSSTSTSSTAKK